MRLTLIAVLSLLAAPVCAQDMMSREFKSVDEIPANTAIPETLLTQNYQNCLIKAAESKESDETRQAYCACMRDKIAATWDLRHYVGFAMDQSAGKNVDDGLREIQALAEGCIKKTLGDKPVLDGPGTLPIN